MLSLVCWSGCVAPRSPWNERWISHTWMARSHHSPWGTPPPRRSCPSRARARLAWMTGCHSRTGAAPWSAPSYGTMASTCCNNPKKNKWFLVEGFFFVKMLESILQQFSSQFLLLVQHLCAVLTTAVVKHLWNCNMCVCVLSYQAVVVYCLSGWFGYLSCGNSSCKVLFLSLPPHKWQLQI